ncbi:hypothetical protein LTR95_008552 [Oleoguttula sp. CCFEE 5521]
MRRPLNCLTTAAVLLITRATPTSAGLWTIDIDRSPAPSPEDGPPFSAHASRDRSLLPYQITGIAASYLGTLLILAVFLLTIGRRMRRRALNVGFVNRGTEMVKPLSTAFDPSPISPVSVRTLPWRSPKGKKKSVRSPNGSMRSGLSNTVSPGIQSVASFDSNVVEADRARRQEEMEKLYAAVMAQDEQKGQSSNVQEQYGGPPPQYSRPRPTRLLTDAPALRHLQPENSQYPISPLSPMSPRSPIRAIYPPDTTMPPLPQGPTSPIRAEYPTTPLTPVFPRANQTSDLPLRDRATSVGSSRTYASASSGSGNPKKLRKSMRHLKISSPMIRPDIDDNSDGARTPLSPRFYTDPGIPPEPPTSRTTDTVDSQAYPPTTPGTPWQYEERVDEVRDLPLAHPQRPVPAQTAAAAQSAGYQYSTPAQALTDHASLRPDPTRPGPSRTPPRTLPFRSQPQQFPPISAGPTKTTFLEVTRNQRFGNGLGTGGVRTAGLATPYSPYMPFTPLTPVTPRLTTRAERRARQREERDLRGAAIAEEDEVKEDGEMWGDGYA